MYLNWAIIYNSRHLQGSKILMQLLLELASQFILPYVKYTICCQEVPLASDIYDHWLSYLFTLFHFSFTKIQEIRMKF